jgi:hypothetical protein
VSHSGRKRIALSILLIVGALLFATESFADSRDSDLCKPAVESCRVSSWLAPVQKHGGTPEAKARASDEPAGMASPSPSLERKRHPESTASTRSEPYSASESGGQPHRISGSRHVTALAESTSPPSVVSRSSWLDKLGWPDTPSLTLGARVWFSQGKSAWNFAVIGGPNVASELTWQGQNAKIYELKADLVVRRFVSNVTLGWGGVDQGTLRDQDFENDYRQGIFSDTLSSPTDGYVVYGSWDIGPRLIQWTYKGLPGAVDVLAGFQYWREKYTARGFNVLLCRTSGSSDCTNFPTGSSSPANAITETTNWTVIRLGPRVSIPIMPRLTVVGQAFYVPWTQYRLEDIHHLRSDLSQNPSFVNKASGGQGIQLEGSLQLVVWKSLKIEAGYKYWDLRSGGGDNSVFTPCIIQGQGGFSNCIDYNGHVNEANARRQGIFFGAGWTF